MLTCYYDDADMIKLLWVHRRPLPIRASDIGTWTTVLTAMSLLAIITNVFIFAFTTEQVCELYTMHNINIMTKYLHLHCSLDDAIFSFLLYLCGE